MNIAVLIGRQTREADVRYSAENMCIARFSLAVDRRGKDGADFITCVAFGKNAEVIEKYGAKGKKWNVVGHIQTGSYEKNGNKIYTTDVVVDSIEFGESKQAEGTAPAQTTEAPDFMAVPDGMENEIPFV